MVTERESADTCVITGARLDACRAVWDALWRERAPGQVLINIAAPPPPSTLRQVDVLGEDGRVADTLTDPHLVASLRPHLDALAAGFDNCPLLAPALPQADCGVHLLPYLLGADMCHAGDGHDNFTTWPKPLLASPDEACSLALPSPETHPYFQALDRTLRAIPAAHQRWFPVRIGGCSPVDGAAALLGDMAFFLGFHTHPEAMHRLLDRCADLTIALAQFQAARCRHWRAYLGIPGLYVNDLMTAFLSAEHWAEFILPCYRNIAAAMGGIVLGVNSPDPAVLRMAARMEGFLGGTVHKNIPLDTVIACLAGNGVYLLNSHPYNPAFDRPTLHNGAFYNPIVAYPYENYRELYRQLSEKVALAVMIDRPEWEWACRDGMELRVAE